jgi:hypothetical protein
VVCSVPLFPKEHGPDLPSPPSPQGRGQLLAQSWHFGGSDSRSQKNDFDCCKWDTFSSTGRAALRGVPSAYDTEQVFRPSGQHGRLFGQIRHPVVVVQFENKAVKEARRPVTPWRVLGTAQQASAVLCITSIVIFLGFPWSIGAAVASWKRIGIRSDIEAMFPSSPIGTAEYVLVNDPATRDHRVNDVVTNSGPQFNWSPKRWRYYIFSAIEKLINELSFFEIIFGNDCVVDGLNDACCSPRVMDSKEPFSSLRD